MGNQLGTFRVSSMSRVLQVSRSGFLCLAQTAESAIAQAAAPETHGRWSKKAFDAKKGRSGSPGLTLDLADARQQYDRKTVAESMRRQRLCAKAANKFKATTEVV